MAGAVQAHHMRASAKPHLTFFHYPEQAALTSRINSRFHDSEKRRNDFTPMVSIHENLVSDKQLF